MREEPHPAYALRPPAFTPLQRNGIRKIARRFRYPPDQQWDFVHETWLKVHDGWIHVPRVEPGMTRYVFKLARHLAIDLFRRFEDDMMTGAVVFSCLPEWEREDEPEDPDEDRPGTPQIVRLTMDDWVLARQVCARGVQRDADATGWMVRAKAHRYTVPEIASDVGRSATVVYKRVARLVAHLRATLSTALPPAADEARPPEPRGKPESRPDVPKRRRAKPKRRRSRPKRRARSVPDRLDQSRVGDVPVGRDERRVGDAS